MYQNTREMQTCVVVGHKLRLRRFLKKFMYLMSSKFVSKFYFKLFNLCPVNMTSIKTTNIYYKIFCNLKGKLYVTPKYLTVSVH